MTLKRKNLHFKNSRKSDEVFGYSILNKIDRLKKEQKAEKFRDILKPKYFVILPDDPLKIKWDLLISV